MGRYRISEYAVGVVLIGLLSWRVNYRQRGSWWCLPSLAFGAKPPGRPSLTLRETTVNEPGDG